MGESVVSTVSASLGGCISSIMRISGHEHIMAFHLFSLSFHSSNLHCGFVCIDGKEPVREHIL